MVKESIEAMDDLFPVNLNLRGRKCLVVGGGSVAERKVKSLLRCGAEIWIVSPEFTTGLEELAGQSKINLIHRHYDTEDLQDCFLVISAAISRKARILSWSNLLCRILILSGEPVGD